MSGTVSFTFAASLAPSNMGHFNSYNGNCSGNFQGTSCTNNSPFFSSNASLTGTGCNEGWFGNLWDSQTKGSSSGNCGNSCSKTIAGCTCSSSCSGEGCASYFNCTNINCGQCACGKPQNYNTQVTYNCYQPNASIVPMGNGMPTPSFTFKGFDTNSGQPNFVYYTVTYNVSDITTPAQVQQLITAFGSSSPNVPSGYAQSNDQNLSVLLQSVCSTNASNLTTAPCSSYCGVGQSTANGTVNGTAIGQNPNNCPAAYTAYCNQNSTFTNNTCTNWYTASQINSALPSSSDAYQVLTTQCSNQAYYSAPTNPDAVFPDDTYTINPSAPPICGCFYPPVVSNTFYTALNNQYPGIVAGSSSVACNFPPCAQNEVSLSVLNANPTCPSTNLTSCVNNLYANNSSLNNFTQSNTCNQNITNTATDTSNNVTATGCAPPLPTTTTTPPSGLVLAAVASKKPTSSSSSHSAIIMAFAILFIVLGIVILGFILYRQYRQSTSST